MTRFLQGADPMSTLDSPAVHSIPMEKLRVFNECRGERRRGSGETPVRAGRATEEDEKNTTIDEILVPRAAEAKVPRRCGEEWDETCAN